MSTSQHGMIAMYERLDEFARTLPEPQASASWDVFYRQHVRNAERMRSAAFRFALADLGRGLRNAGGTLARGLRGQRPGLPGGEREADALQR